MNAPNPTFLKHFNYEVQNRAFALLGCKGMLAKASKPEDIMWYEAWKAFEEFQQEKYAPMAQKYGLSQAPTFFAKMQSSIGNVVASFLSEKMMMSYMLKQTIKYVEQLEEMARLAPEEDKAFFNYVVEQERLQVDVLPLRIDGKNKESADLLLGFIDRHRA